jgi:CheY-like chemotaxis protein
MSAGTVLLVDESAETVKVAKAILSHGSYDVLTAGSGEEALDILAAQAHVDLIVAEVLMASGMSGPALLRKVSESYPATAVMLMTGFCDVPLDGAFPLLNKPFTTTVLLGRVQEVLAESRRVAEALQRTSETNLGLRGELEFVRCAAREAIRQSRQKRAERFCSRLRAAKTVIPTVLVAEHDEILRYTVCRFLTGCGFRVLEAADGREALELSREHRGRIEILVTDIGMPRLDGVQLADALGTERPRTRIVFITGEDTKLRHPVVRKPFDLDDLLAGIVEILSAG